MFFRINWLLSRSVQLGMVLFVFCITDRSANQCPDSVSSHERSVILFLVQWGNILGTVAVNRLIFIFWWCYIPRMWTVSRVPTEMIKTIKRCHCFKNVVVKCFFKNVLNLSSAQTGALRLIGDNSLYVFIQCWCLIWDCFYLSIAHFETVVPSGGCLNNNSYTLRVITNQSFHVTNLIDEIIT